MLVAHGIGVIITTSDVAKMQRYLDLCLTSLSQQEDLSFEVVLSCLSNEHQRVEILNHWPRRITVVHTLDNRPDDVGWCASRARNAGALHCSREYLLFSDGDIVFPPRALSFAMSQLEQSRFVRFSVKNSRCTPEQTEELAKEMLDCTDVPLCGGSHGAVAVTRSAWEGCGGYDEQFRGWGGDDQEFFERAVRYEKKAISDSERENIWLLHLKHPAWTIANHDPVGKKKNNELYWHSTNTKRTNIPVAWGDAVMVTRVDK